MTEQHRDDDLGPEIRELPVPEHKPGFWERLDRRLEAEGAVGDDRRPRSSGGQPLSALSRYLPLLIAALVVIVIVVLVVL